MALAEGRRFGKPRALGRGRDVGGGDRPGRHRRGRVDRARRRAEGRGAAARRALRRGADARGLRRRAAGGGRGERRGGGDVARPPPRFRRARRRRSAPPTASARRCRSTPRRSSTRSSSRSTAAATSRWRGRPSRSPAAGRRGRSRSSTGHPTAASARCRSRPPAMPTTCGWRARRRAAPTCRGSATAGRRAACSGRRETAIAPVGGGFDAPASPEPKNARTLGARVAAVGDSLLTIYTDAQGPAARGRTHDRRRLPHAHRADPVGRAESELDGSLATWSQPRIRMARRLPGGRWARVEAATRRAREKRGFDAVRATAAEGRRVHRRVAGHTRPRARRRADALGPRRRAPRGPPR